MLFYCYRPKRVVFALRAEFLFLSFPKEKETKKKENLRAAPLKILPLYRVVTLNQEQRACLFSQLRVALCASDVTHRCAKCDNKFFLT